MTKSVPTGTLARTGIAGTGLMKAGSQYLTHAALRPFLSDLSRNNKKEILDENTARLVFTTLAQLRGTALKIAQMFSMETSLLSESYRQELSKSYHQAPPLGRPLVRKVVRQAFGKSPEQFGDWLTKPFKSKTFSFANHNASYSAEALNSIHEFTKLNLIDEQANEFIFFDRTFFGLYQIFERMNATVKMQHQWLV